jgi:hypothetical protein
MLTVNILWIALIGALSGLAFILIIPFFMIIMIVYQSIAKVISIKLIGRIFTDFHLPFVEAYLSGRKRKK